MAGTSGRETEVAAGAFKISLTPSKTSSFDVTIVILTALRQTACSPHTARPIPSALAAFEPHGGLSAIHSIIILNQGEESITRLVDV